MCVDVSMFFTQEAVAATVHLYSQLGHGLTRLENVAGTVVRVASINLVDHEPVLCDNVLLEPA